ncbi:MAG: hypothetical protein IJX12_08395 [Lachnospiraceae bacterium]|nr:hypothetical protein [Lachnospiraceae bacterium]
MHIVVKGVIYKMDVQLKTASFGGYDKKAVESYIEELQADHEKEVSELKASVVKLSETVKNLHTMREVNLNESSSTIDNLKKVNDELQVEVTQLKHELEAYRVKEEESASRYESISRTLLEARESADMLKRQTEKECNELRARTEDECQQLTDDTVAACDKLTAETTSACQEMRETTYADCEELKRRTKEETDALIADTEYNCKVANEETAVACEDLTLSTQSECEEMRNQARIEAYNTRMAVKRECESLSDYMSQLMTCVDNVVKACDETKLVADQAFPGLS